jgi:hypothetical protein
MIRRIESCFASHGVNFKPLFKCTFQLKHKLNVGHTLLLRMFLLVYIRGTSAQYYLYLSVTAYIYICIWVTDQYKILWQWPTLINIVETHGFGPTRIVAGNDSYDVIWHWKWLPQIGGPLQMSTGRLWASPTPLSSSGHNYKTFLFIYSYI